MRRAPVPRERNLKMRNWKATVRPHWMVVGLGIVGTIVALGQVCVYFRRAAIMNAQAAIMKDQAAIMKDQFTAYVQNERAFLVIDDLHMESQTLMACSFSA
jgi:hypothetical protein